MTIRTTKSTVTFRAPFLVKGMTEPQPAGTYDVEIDEEALETWSGRNAYRRVATLLLVKKGGCTHTVSVDSHSLEAALAADQAVTQLAEATTS